MPRCCVLLVDDSPLFLASVAQLLSAAEGIEIIGQCLSGYDALGEVETLRPDVVLLDIAMPGKDGIQTAKEIKALPRAPRVVLVTLYDSEEYRHAALAARADAFIAKTDFGTQAVPLLLSLCEDDRAENRDPNE
jgi:DNA-binding NarL/FixJ family response regulator